MVKEWDKSCSDETAGTDIKKLFGYQGNILGVFSDRPVTLFSFITGINPKQSKK